MLKFLQRTFDTTNRRDQYISKLINCVTAPYDEEPKAIVFRVNEAAQPVIDYLSRNPNDPLAGKTLVDAAKLFKQSHGAAEAAVVEYQMIRDLIHAGKDSRGSVGYYQTITSLCDEFENDMATNLTLDRNNYNHVGFMSLGSEYSSVSFGCEALSHKNSQIRKASSEAFLKVCETHFEDMHQKNRDEAIRHVYKLGTPEQKDRLLTLVKKYLPHIRSLDQLVDNDTRQSAIPRALPGSSPQISG